MTLIMVFGDSIVYGAWDKFGGWVQKLRTFLEEKENDEYLIYNLGIPINESSEEVVKRFEFETKARMSDDFKEENIIIFAIGTNDTQFMQSKNNLRNSLEKFNENVKKLNILARKYASRIIFIGFTPCDESKTNPIPWKENISYKNEYIKKYDINLKSICKENKVYFIDIFDKFMKLNYKDLLEDGLHPNSKGHQKIFEIVKDFLIENKII